jgi:hypothetical protein
LKKYILAIIILIYFTSKWACADSVSIYAENDCLEKMPDDSSSDGYYTAGEQITYHNDDNWGVKIASQIYTPSDKNNPLPEYNDRPYAGWLHLDVYQTYYRENKAIDTFTLGLGVVGPASGGEWIQTEVHKLIDSSPPMGWEYQLKNEPTIQLSSYRMYSVFLNKWMEYRPSAGVDLGNARTDLALGNTIRTGYNIPNDFDPVIKKIKSFQDEFYAYAFVSCNGQLVLHDIFLDGNTFKDNEVTVDKKPLVADFHFGISLGLKYIDVTVTHVERTKEFETQTRDNRFDSIQISYNF